MSFARSISSYFLCCARLPKGTTLPVPLVFQNQRASRVYRSSAIMTAVTTFTRACEEFRAMAVKSSPSEPIFANLDGLLAELETIYKDIHSHPELYMQEERTAGVAA